MENSYIINGGQPLHGQVKLSGAKNVALKVIIASLMIEGGAILQNIPRINDVFELLNLIKVLGGQAEFKEEENTVAVDGGNINKNEVDLLYASKIRVSFMFFAPLLKKFGSCRIPNPGGCRIGARPIDRIVDGIKALGVSVRYKHDTGYYQAEMTGKPRGKFVFGKPSHTGTELLILMSVFGEGMIRLENCAREPEIKDMIDFLNAAGAKIRQNASTIEITGVDKLRCLQPFTITADRNEAVTYASLAIATKGEAVVSSIPERMIRSFIIKLQAANGGYEKINETTFRFFYKGELKATNIETEPHPGFMTDWQPNWAVLMTQATGVSLITERVFENRFAYVEELRKLGAEIEFVKPPVTNPAEYFFFNFDPAKKYNQAVRIKGPVKLHGGALNITDLRAGATLAIGALVAEGESVVNGASILERGYENFVEKVRSIGGEIERI